MNILGINPNHHGSICLLQDGKIKYYIQEERITRNKYDSYPFKSFINFIQNNEIDILSLSTPSLYFPSQHNELDKWNLNFFKTDKENEFNIQLNPSKVPSLSNYWFEILNHYKTSNSNKTLLYDFSHLHHTSHALHSFYNSGFDKAISLVIDGLGSAIYTNNPEFSRNFEIGTETESIFYCELKNNKFKFQPLFKNLHTDNFLNSEENIFPKYDINVSNDLNLSRVYEVITRCLGFKVNEEGKTMGLSSYGKYNPSIPSFFSNTNSSDVLKKRNKYLEENSTIHDILNTDKYPQFKNLNPKDNIWHYDKSKITDLEKDIAWKIQNETEQIVKNYIDNILTKSNIKNICCGGGYFLNCVTNYSLKKSFPHVNFYIEPVANDAGTSIGAALLAWFNYLGQDNTKNYSLNPLKSLYLGKKYSKNELLKGINKYVDN